MPSTSSYNTRSLRREKGPLKRSKRSIGSAVCAVDTATGTITANNLGVNECVMRSDTYKATKAASGSAFFDEPVSNPDTSSIYLEVYESFAGLWDCSGYVGVITCEKLTLTSSATMTTTTQAPSPEPSFMHTITYYSTVTSTLAPTPTSTIISKKVCKADRTKDSTTVCNAMKWTCGQVTCASVSCELSVLFQNADTAFNAYYSAKKACSSSAGILVEDSQTLTTTITPTTEIVQTSTSVVSVNSDGTYTDSVTVTSTLAPVATATQVPVKICKANPSVDASQICNAMKWACGRITCESDSCDPSVLLTNADKAFGKYYIEKNGCSSSAGMIEELLQDQIITITPTSTYVVTSVFTISATPTSTQTIEPTSTTGFICKADRTVSVDIVCNAMKWACGKIPCSSVSCDTDVLYGNADKVFNDYYIEKNACSSSAGMLVPIDGPEPEISVITETVKECRADRSVSPETVCSAMKWACGRITCLSISCDSSVLYTNADYAFSLYYKTKNACSSSAGELVDVEQTRTITVYPTVTSSSTTSSSVSATSAPISTSKVATTPTTAPPEPTTTATTPTASTTNEPSPTVAPTVVNTIPNRDMRAMWVWEILPSQLSDMEAQTAFFNFLQKPHGMQDHGINRVFYSVPTTSFSGTEGQLLRRLIQNAHARGIAVEWLDGEAEWVTSDDKMQIPISRCQQVMNFNAATDDPSDDFDGIHLDIEPHTLGSIWRQNTDAGNDNYNDALTSRTLHILKECRAIVDTQGKTLANDVGHDYSTYVTDYWEAMRKEKYVHYTGIMNYFDDESLFIQWAEKNMELAGDLPLVFGSETIMPPHAEGWQSFWQEGHIGLHKMLNNAKAHLTSLPQFEHVYHGLAVHHFHSYQLLTAFGESGLTKCYIDDDMNLIATDMPDHIGCVMRDDIYKGFVPEFGQVNLGKIDKIPEGGIHIILNDAYRSSSDCRGNLGVIRCDEPSDQSETVDDCVLNPDLPGCQLDPECVFEGSTLTVTGLGASVGCAQRTADYTVAKSPIGGTITFNNIKYGPEEPIAVELYNTWVDSASCVGYVSVLTCSRIDGKVTPAPEPCEVEWERFDPNGTGTGKVLPSPNERTLFLWSMNERILDSEQYVDLEDFLEYLQLPNGPRFPQNRIDRLHFSIPDIKYLYEDTYTAKLRSVLRRLSDIGIKSEIILGFEDWILFPYSRFEALEVTNKVIQFNKGSSSQSERFEGIHLNLRPNVLPSWREDAGLGEDAFNDEIQKNYVTVLKEMKNTLAPTNLTLAMYIDEDFTSLVTDIWGKVTCGKLVDYASVLIAYDKAQPFISGPLSSAGGMRRNFEQSSSIPMMFVAETDRPFQTPSPNTFWEEGFSQLFSTLAEVKSELVNEEGSLYEHLSLFRGFGIHHYGSFRELNERGNGAGNGTCVITADDRLNITGIPESIGCVMRTDTYDGLQVIHSNSTFVGNVIFESVDGIPLNNRGDIGAPAENGLYVEFYGKHRNDKWCSDYRLHIVCEKAS
eukprot:Nk52_evm46s1810 gene=Nk52_evmTU46s1810